MDLREALTVRLVLPPVWSGVFRHAEQPFGALRELGLTVEVAELAASSGAALNIVLGWSVFEPGDSGRRALCHPSLRVAQAALRRRLLMRGLDRSFPVR